MYDGDPPIESIKPETDINPVSADAEKLSELVECQDIPTIEQEQDMGIAKEYGTIETEEKIIDLSAPSLAEGELQVTILTANIATPEETPGVCRYSRVKSQTKPDYIPSMSDKKYETVNTQLKCKDTLHPDDHIFICQKLIEEAPDVSAVLMTQLSPKAGMKR